MSECLCPRCGYVWENDGPPLSPALKAAVRDHMAGMFPSVAAAMLEQARPAAIINMRACQKACDQDDLERFKANKLYNGPINPGAIFVWEPFRAHAADIVQVMNRVEDRGAESDNVQVRTLTLPAPIWVEASRFREAVVRAHPSLTTLRKNFAT